MTDKTCDVAIIGSGIGGLCAAARLAHRGYRTLVVEKLPLVGGRFSSLEDKGFNITTGAMGIECGGALEETFQEVEAEFNVRRPPAPTLKYRIEGEDHEVPEGGGGLRKLVSIAAGEPEEADRVMAAIKRALTWKQPSRSLTLRQWLSHYTNDERVLGVFQSFCSAIFASNAHEIPAAEFIAFIKTSRFRDYGFPPGGNRQVVETLAKRVREMGGEVWTRASAKRILVEEGKTVGIEVDREGEQVLVEAQAVISDVGPIETVRLAGEDNVDRGYLRHMEETLRPAPGISIFITSERPLIDHPGVTIVTGTRRLSFLACTTLLCPEQAPKGQHLLIAFGVPGSCLGPLDFNREIQLTLQDLREVVPGFDRYGRLHMVGTFHGRWPVYRTWQGFDLPQRTPIENLYNVGDGVKLSGCPGLEGCAETARVVVEDIEGRFRPR
jgi:phytoene dehydrogenase-like protein